MLHYVHPCVQRVAEDDAILKMLTGICISASSMPARCISSRRLETQQSDVVMLQQMLIASWHCSMCQHEQDCLAISIPMGSTIAYITVRHLAVHKRLLRDCSRNDSVAFAVPLSACELLWSSEILSTCASNTSRRCPTLL